MKKTGSLLILILAVGLAAAPLVSAEDDPSLNGSYPTTEYQWVTLGSHITQITTGLRITHHHWYGESCIGALSAFDNRENSFFLSLNLGRRFPLTTWLFLGADVGFRHVIPDGTDNPGVDTSKFFTLDARLKLEVVLGRHMSIFVGGGTTNIYQGNSLGSDTVHKGSAFLGVGLL